MKRLYYILTLTAAALVGGTISWFYSYFPQADFEQDKINIEDILEYSNVTISEGNFSCGVDVENNVGSVVGSIVELNSLNKRNMLTFGCFENTCSIMVTNCMPWKSQECGNRILKLNINQNNKIITESFTCIDMP